MRNKLSDRLSVFYSIVFLLLCLAASALIIYGNYDLGAVCLATTLLMCMLKDSLDVIGEKIDGIQRQGLE